MNCFFHVLSVFSILWDTSSFRLWLHKLHQILSSPWPLLLLLCYHNYASYRERRCSDTICYKDWDWTWLVLFWTWFLKVQKKELLIPAGRKKEKIINIFLETEETGTQQEIILKCKNMHNCYGDEVSHSL